MALTVWMAAIWDPLAPGAAVWLGREPGVGHGVDVRQPGHRDGHRQARWRYVPARRAARVDPLAAIRAE